MDKAVTILQVASLLLGAGCRDAKDSEAPKTSGILADVAPDDPSRTSGPDSGDAPPATEPRTIPDLDVRADVPRGARMTPAPVGDGVVIHASNLVVTVQKIDAARPLDDVKSRAKSEHSGYDLAAESLEDGWVVTFVSDGPSKTNYWVDAYRKIDGDKYYCSTTLASENLQTRAVDLCKSLTR